MKITELMTEDIMCLDLASNTKKEVIRELSTLLVEANKVSNLEKFVAEIEAREELSTTGVGYGVAIPHAKTKFVKTPALAFGKSKEGIDYDSMDGEDAHIFFMIAAPADGANLHLQTLAKLSRKLIDEDFRNSLHEATTKEEVLHILSSIDKEEK